MYNTLLIILFLFTLLSCKENFPQTKEKNEEKNKTNQASNLTKLKTGDIIFQTSQSSQGKAIQLASHSLYSHVGILYEENSIFYVYEAVQPVKMTLLDEWIARGKEGHYVVKRLKNANIILTDDTILKLKTVIDF